MIRRAPFAFALGVLLLVSPPARAPTMNAVRAIDVDPLLGPWPVEQQLLPQGAIHAGSPVSILLRPAVDRLNQAWASLRSLLDRAAPALRAVERVLSTPGSSVPVPNPDAVFVRGSALGAINLADVFVKLTAIAFVGALVLVPAGCARVSASIYGPAPE